MGALWGGKRRVTHEISSLHPEEEELAVFVSVRALHVWRIFSKQSRQRVS